MATQLSSLKRPRGFPTLSVDGFNFQAEDISHYILTHFHSDHTTGLSSAFGGPQPIWTTEITARLLVEIMGVRADLVRACVLGQEYRLIASQPAAGAGASASSHQPARTSPAPTASLPHSLRKTRNS